MRVDTIHRRLSIANLEFCKLTSPSLGLGLHALNRYGRRFKDAAKAVGVSDAATVAYVLPGAPADVGGLHSGDTLTAINGKALGVDAQAIRNAERELRALPANAPARLSVRRGAESLDIQVTPETACGYPVQVAEGDEVNAYADGKVVVIPRGMLRFARNDDELALIMGHELAHNAMGHIDAQKQNQMMGMAGGLVLDVLLAATTGYASDTFSRAGAQAGALAYSKEFENEADYAGLYFMARANYDIDNVETFWRRMAADSPQAIFVGQSHPTTPERFVSITRAREEIRAKQVAHLALRPRMKGDAADTALAAASSAAPSPAAPADAASAPAVTAADGSPPAPAGTSPTTPTAAASIPASVAAVVSTPAPTAALVPPEATKPPTP